VSEGGGQQPPAEDVEPDDGTDHAATRHHSRRLRPLRSLANRVDDMVRPVGDIALAVATSVTEVLSVGRASWNGMTNTIQTQ
jgi:hypothetical protein